MIGFLELFIGLLVALLWSRLLVRRVPRAAWVPWGMAAGVAFGVAVTAYGVRRQMVAEPVPGAEIDLVGRQIAEAGRLGAVWVVGLGLAVLVALTLRWMRSAPPDEPLHD